MMSLQEYLDQKYPTKADKESVTKISVRDIYREMRRQGITELLQGGELDLKEFNNLEKIVIGTDYDIHGTYARYFEPLTKLILGDCPNLTLLYCSYNNLTSVDFLEELVCPEKLICLRLCRNNIESTDIEVFSKFTNLETLWIGKSEGNKRNHFFGSFKSWINLTKLKSLDIADTDIDSGLEYLPEKIEIFNCLNEEKNSKSKKIEENLKVMGEVQKFFGYHSHLLKKWKKDHDGFLLRQEIRILETKITKLKNKLEQEREAHLDGILAAEDWYTVQIPKQIQQKRSNCQEQGGSLTIADYQAQIEFKSLLR